MARNLYRVYLYVVALTLLVFGAVATGFLASKLLSETTLRGPYRAPASRAEVIQAAVFAVVAWLLAGSLGGVHYWLLRRDMRNDPAAAGGGVRALLLNGVEAVAVLTGVSLLAGSVGSIGLPYSDVSGALVGGFMALGVAAVLELERRRAAAASRPARVFERLHLYGVPLLLLLVAAPSAWIAAVQLSLSGLLVSAGRVASGCAVPDDCATPSLIALWGTVGIVAATLGVYAYLSRGDTRSTLRALFHLLSFGYGMIFTLVGLERGLELVIRAILRVSVSWSDVIGAYSFVPPLTFGLTLVAVYVLWLRADAMDTGEHSKTRLPVLALATGLLAVPFWLGSGTVLYFVVEHFTSLVSQPSAPVWASALALLLTGSGYIVLAPLLGRRSRGASTAAHRAVVFAQLAVGMLATVIGAAIALYTAGTALLGEPVANWPSILRIGLVVLVIGMLMGGLHLYSALRNRYVGGRSATSASEHDLVEAASPV